jgi:hypothetical protein
MSHPEPSSRHDMMTQVSGNDKWASHQDRLRSIHQILLIRDLQQDQPYCIKSAVIVDDARGATRSRAAINSIQLRSTRHPVSDAFLTAAICSSSTLPTFFKFPFTLSQSREGVRSYFLHYRPYALAS